MRFARFPALLLACTLVAGFAAGAWLAPMLHPSSSATASGGGASSTRSLGFDDRTSAHASAAPAGQAPSLDDVLKSRGGPDWSYQGFKDIVAYSDSINVSDIPDTLQQIKKRQQSIPKMMLLTFLTMRWANPGGRTRLVGEKGQRWRIRVHQAYRLRPFLCDAGQKRSGPARLPGRKRCRAVRSATTRSPPWPWKLRTTIPRRP